MVRNGGAETGYSTAISIVRAGNPLTRQFALIARPNLFSADDNDGLVRWGNRGQLDIKVNWVSSSHLLIRYPAKTRLYKQVTSYRSVTVQYLPLQ